MHFRYTRIGVDVIFCCATFYPLGYLLLENPFILSFLESESTLANFRSAQFGYLKCIRVLTVAKLTVTEKRFRVRAECESNDHFLRDAVSRCSKSDNVNMSAVIKYLILCE